MPMKRPSSADIEALTTLFDQSDWKELDIRMDGFELFLSKDPNARRSLSATPVRETPPQAAAPAASAAPAVPSSAVTNPKTIPDHWVAVRAPNLGTFYRSPKPGAPPYVEVGKSVTAETEVCLIEVMKLFTAVRAGVAGTVREVVVQDGELVEYDQVLLYVEPQ